MKQHYAYSVSGSNHLTSRLPPPPPTKEKKMKINTSINIYKVWGNRDLEYSFLYEICRFRKTVSFSLTLANSTQK